MKKIYLIIFFLNITLFAFASFFKKNSNDTTLVTDTCYPLSTLPCTAIKVSLPYTLSFNAGVPGTLNDNNGLGTGFTLAVPYSGVRLSADGIPSNPSVPGYQPANIKVTGGTLQLTANKGIDYLTNNNQINLLGVQVAQSGKLFIEVALLNPLNGASSQQAGLWYGLNDHSSVKLVINANKIEFRREFNDISSNISGLSNPDQRITPVIGNLNTKTVRLRIVVDSLNSTAEGFYSLDGGVTYVSTGMGYSSTGLNIAGMGLTGVSGYAAIYATYRNAALPAIYTFENFSIYSNPEVVSGSLSFSADSLGFTVYSGGAVTAQSVVLSGNNPGNVSFTSINAPWLTLPPAGTGTLNFSASNISSNLSPGTYKGFMVAAAPNYRSATLGIRLIISGIGVTPVLVNFQDPLTVPPTAWIRDYGQAYGLRSGLYQSAGLFYGWRKRSDATALNLTLNGFNRNSPEDVTLATLIYMQANNLAGTFPGIKTQAYWEYKLPNGTYDVNVSAGDGVGDNNAEIDNINVEGVKAISGFVPSGPAGGAARFKQVTVRVPLKDEHLTITADGGTNTKINFAQITPVSIAPYIGWSNGVQDLIIQKGKVSKKFSVNTGNSSNAIIIYNFSVTYGSGATNWLKFNTLVTSAMPLLNFDYSAASALPIGIYTAAVRAYNAAFTSAYMNIQLRVIDSASPYVISSSPASGLVNVDPSTVSIAANNLSVPIVAGFKGGVDNSTITSSTAKLFALVDTSSVAVNGIVQGTGGGDAISFSPSASLSPNTTYKFIITNGVKSYSGAAFIPFSSTFTTGPASVDTNNTLNAQFLKVPITGTQNKNYTTLKIGPDGKFYALMLNGNIERYNISKTDGTLSNVLVIPTLVTKYGSRSAIGLTFDPTSNASNLICYVSHSASGLTNAPAFSSNISVLSGATLQNEQLLISNLPRSTRDHMSNSLAFGPDGALYLCQGSNSSAGAYDPDWQRAESLLSGSILRIDLTMLAKHTLPLNVLTTANQSLINAAPANSYLMTDGTYNPYSTVSPLTIYASGIRNAYDLVWHSNGQLYLPTNGSGGGGNSPASVTGTRRPDGTYYNGPVIPATTGIQVQLDWLFRVNPLKNIGYFGHPNPYRGQYVENRGYLDNPLYAQTIMPDADYRGYAYNFGLNHSPDGAIEYKSNTFNGVLKNKLLVCRFSGGGDIVVMEPGSLIKVPSITATSNDHIYDIIKVTTGAGNNGLVGMSGFANPLNLVEDTTNGNLYVAEYNWNLDPNLMSQITLLKVQAANMAIAPKMVINAGKLPDVEGLLSFRSYNVTIANRGDGPLKIKDIVLNGPDAAMFSIEGITLPQKEVPMVINKNSSLSFTVNTPASIIKNRSVKVVVQSLNDSAKEVILNVNAVADTTLAKTDSTITNGKLQGNNATIILYPNPNPGTILHILLKNFKSQEPATIYLYSMMGEQLLSSKITMDPEGGYLGIINLPRSKASAFYVIRAVAASATKEAKILVGANSY